MCITVHISGPEPAILDWYGHCVHSSVGGSGGMLSQEKNFKLGTLRPLLRPCLRQNATRISPHVVSVTREATDRAARAARNDRYT